MTHPALPLKKICPEKCQDITGSYILQNKSEVNDCHITNNKGTFSQGYHLTNNKGALSDSDFHLTMRIFPQHIEKHDSFSYLQN